MKSTCEERASAIHLLVEGELGPEEAQELTGHIEQCVQCSEMLEELSRMRSILEESFAARIVLPDKDVTTRRAVEAVFQKRSTGAVGRFFKWAAIGTAAGLAAVLLATALFVRLYFDKTFPDEITGTVMRASSGILAQANDDSRWLPLRPAYPVKRGMRIKLAQEGKSVLSFDGLSILASAPAEIRTIDTRTFSLEKGSVAVASADRSKSLTIALGDGSIETNDSTLRLSASGASFTVDCISGSADVIVSGSKKRKISSGQGVLIAGKTVRNILADIENPFDIAKVSVLERIKRRFDSVMAQYVGSHPWAAGERQLGSVESYEFSHNDSEVWQFASYVKQDRLWLAQRSDKSWSSDYYERLFSPSSRAITVGRQRTVPLEPGKGATFPRWSHDGSMLAYIEVSPGTYRGKAKVVRLDDLENPWDISQEYDMVRPMFPLTWAPDDRHLIFQVQTKIANDPRGLTGEYELKIAPIDPSEGPIIDFESPFYDIPLPVPLPVGKTISPGIARLPWGNMMVCANWGNLACVPVEENGQAFRGAPGFFLTNFDPRECFVMGGGFSPSGSMMDFTAVEDLNFNRMSSYILYEVEDIIDGFAPPPRSLDDPRIKRAAPTDNMQFTGGFSFDESLVFVHEDVNRAFDARFPTFIEFCDFDIFYANAAPDASDMATQIHIPGNQMFLQPSPEGNRITYFNSDDGNMELRIVSFDIEADMDMDLGGVLIDNSGTNLIVPPGTLDENFTVKISTPLSIDEEAELVEGDNAFFAMRLIEAEGLENPKFIEPMTLTIRYTDEEIEGLDEGMVDLYYYDESDPDNPGWIALGGTVDTEHNEVTVEIRHFSKFSVGGRILGGKPPARFLPPRRGTRGPGELTPRATRAGDAIDTSMIVVKEGVGFGDILVTDPACTKEFVQSIFGQPGRETDRFLDYQERYRMNFFFARGGGRVTEIRLNSGFQGQLASGISLSSSMEDVFDMYGEPEVTVNSDTMNIYPGDRTLLKKGIIGKIHYEDEGLLFWFKGSRINQIVIFERPASRTVKENIREKPFPPASQEDTSGIVVEAGVGFGDFSLIDPACSKEFIKSRLGPPDRERDRFLDYEGRYRLNLFFSRGGGRLTEVRLNRGFQGQLASGISLSSSMEDVFDMYGEPSAVVHSDNLNVYPGDRTLIKRGNIGKIYYQNEGLLFWFMGSRINQIVTFMRKPERPSYATKKCPGQ